MSSIKLDIGKFKHVKTQGNSTTLRHQDGHEITLAHNKLSPDNQKALSALAGLSKAASTPLQSNEARDQKMAKGGQPNNPKLAESKKTLPKQMLSMAIENITSPGDEPGNQGGGMAKGGKVQGPTNPSLAESRKSITHDNLNTSPMNGSLENMRYGWANGGGVEDDVNPPEASGAAQLSSYEKNKPLYSSDHIPPNAPSVVRPTQQSSYGGDSTPEYGSTPESRAATAAAKATAHQRALAEAANAKADGGQIKTPWITPDKPQQLETPETKRRQNEKDAERRRKIERKDIRLNYDEGGKVPMPPTESAAPAPAPIKKNEVDSAGGWSGAWQNLTHPQWAEGGEVCPACKRPHYDSGGNIKDSFKNEAGMPQRKMYADSDEQVSATDNAPSVTGTPDIGGVKKVVPYQTETSPNSMDMAAKRKEYNDIVAAHNAGFFGDPEDMSGVGPTRKGQFGPDDQPPQQFDPKAWQQMETERQQSKDANAAQVAKEAMNTAAYNQSAQQAGLPLKPTMDVPRNQDTNDATQMPQQSPQDQNQGHGQNQGQQPQNDLGQGQYQRGVNELASIQQKQLANQIQERQSAIDAYKNQYAELDQERKAHITDIQNGYIDPDAYWKDHSKVAAGIGMILAGFNPTSRPNAAIDFLNSQINRSIDAQKSNLNAKNNLLSANLQHFGDLHSATMMTSAMLNDQLATKMQQAALTAKNPIAKQAALGASATLLQNATMFQQQLAMRQTMMKLASGGGSPGTQGQAIAMMSSVNPEGAKVYRDAFVPGVGMSRSLTPIPDNVRQQIASGQKLINATQDLIGYVGTHTNINPMSAEYQVGVTKGKILQQMIREGLLGTVFRESEKPLLESFVSENPANIMKRINSDPKLRTLLESTANQLNTLKQTYDLPTAQVQQQQQPQYKTSNGIKYMRGPNGQAIPVR